ncbi:uncharacterized protein PAC_17816 [Phialocephala subalpina]|uniref:Oxidase ustYa n=1 Tax=Phialocephala subalpina TaxID=576137 RepID=A0A1L7XSH0_9HELO|nr:uncharacterized protein PAC_17816 [Phialocephala subalpina]
MSYPNNMEEDTAALLEKGHETDSNIETRCHPAEPRQRHIQFLNIVQWTAHWTCHILLALLLIFTFKESVLVCPSHSAEKILIRHEEGYMDIDTAIQYESQNAEGRDEFGRNPDTSWKGPPTHQNMQKWSDVMQRKTSVFQSDAWPSKMIIFDMNMDIVGMVAITEAEQDALGLNTSRSPHSNELFVILQVYHDLHCLKIMRESFWSFVEGGTASWGLKLHFDHCIDALRQVVMCYADLSPIPKTPGAIDATRNVNRQCRNWDTIEKWATKRNTTGLLIHAHPVFLPEPLQNIS